MKKIVLIAAFVFICFLSVLQPCYADVEWDLNKQLTIEAAPLDIALSSDGQWMFVLTPGQVIIYATADNKVVNRIPVDKTFDKLSYSAADNTLLVAGRTGTAVKLITLETVHKFSVDGLGVKGPENAPVTIAVFSDYQ